MQDLRREKICVVKVPGTTPKLRQPGILRAVILRKNGKQQANWKYVASLSSHAKWSLATQMKGSGQDVYAVAYGGGAQLPGIRSRRSLRFLLIETKRRNCRVRLRAGISAH